MNKDEIANNDSHHSPNNANESELKKDYWENPLLRLTKNFRTFDDKIKAFQ